MGDDNSNIVPIVREFTTGASRDLVSDKLDYRGFISPKALRRFAAYMNKNRRLPDQSLRPSDNWKLGIPIPVYIESLIRHANEFWEFCEDGLLLGDDAAALDEADEAVCGILFNAMGYLHERIKVLDAADAVYPGKRVPGKPPLTYRAALNLQEAHDLQEAA